MRPADVFLPNWTNGKDTCLDITVISSLQQALVDRAAENSGAALDHALQRKNRQSKEDCAKEGLEFIALPVEALGGLHRQTIDVIHKLGQQLARQASGDEALVTNHLFQHLSIMLVKANSALITSRTPSHSPEYIDGDRES